MFYEGGRSDPWPGSWISQAVNGGADGPVKPLVPATAMSRPGWRPTVLQRYCKTRFRGAPSLTSLFLPNPANLTKLVQTLITQDLLSLPAFPHFYHLPEFQQPLQLFTPSNRDCPRPHLPCTFDDLRQKSKPKTLPCSAPEVTCSSQRYSPFQAAPAMD